MIENWSNLELSKKEFPFIEEPFNLGVYSNILEKPLLFNTINNDEEKSNFIFFNVGGLCHNEIASIDKLVNDKKVNQNLILGTDKIIRPQEYVDAIKNLPNELLDTNEI